MIKICQNCRTLILLALEGLDAKYTDECIYKNYNFFLFENDTTEIIFVCLQSAAMIHKGNNRTVAVTFWLAWMGWGKPSVKVLLASSLFWDGDAVSNETTQAPHIARPPLQQLILALCSWTHHRPEAARCVGEVRAFQVRKHTWPPQEPLSLSLHVWSYWLRSTAAQQDVWLELRNNISGGRGGYLLCVLPSKTHTPLSSSWPEAVIKQRAGTEGFWTFLLAGPHRYCGKYWFTSLCVPTCHLASVLKMQISGPTPELLFTRSGEGRVNLHFVEFHPTAPEMTLRQGILPSVWRTQGNVVPTFLLPQGSTWQGAGVGAGGESSWWC